MKTTGWSTFGGSGAFSGLLGAPPALADPALVQLTRRLGGLAGLGRALGSQPDDPAGHRPDQPALPRAPTPVSSMANLRTMRHQLLAGCRRRAPSAARPTPPPAPPVSNGRRTPRRSATSATAAAIRNWASTPARWPNVPEVAPEHMDDYELGYKKTFGHNLVVDLSLFYENYVNAQFPVSVDQLSNGGVNSSRLRVHPEGALRRPRAGNHLDADRSPAAAAVLQLR